MMFITHLLFSMLVGLLLIKNQLLFTTNSKFDAFIVLLVMMFGAIFPDIDHPDSTIGQKVKFISKPINWIFGHRGFLHSLFFALLIYALIFIFSFQIANAFMIGFITHILLDGLTKEGIEIIRPLTDFKIRGPFISNGIAEIFIDVGLCAGLVYYIL